jgi:type IV pilus assembly protein PilX
MNTHRASRLTATRQRGAVLVVSLLLLLVMTLLGLGASQSTRLQERMAGNQRDQEVALQGAEAALRDAERNLSPLVTEFVVTCSEPAAGCDSYEPRTLVNAGTQMAWDLANQADSWWEQWAKEYGNPDQLSDVSAPPQFVVEFEGSVPDVLSESGSNLSVDRYFYTVTARSKGMTRDAQVVIQTSFARIEYR